MRTLAHLLVVVGIGTLLVSHASAQLIQPGSIDYEFTGTLRTTQYDGESDVILCRDEPPLNISIPAAGQTPTDTGLEGRRQFFVPPEDICCSANISLIERAHFGDPLVEPFPRPTLGFGLHAYSQTFRSFSEIDAQLAGSATVQVVVTESITATVRLRTERFLASSSADASIRFVGPAPDETVNLFLNKFPGSASYNDVQIPAGTYSVVLDGMFDLDEVRQNFGYYAKALFGGDVRFSDVAAVSLARAARSCPADTDTSGTVTVADILNFLSLWSGSDPLADWNGDGVWSVSDILNYLADWSAGCVTV